jgi:hypothetical protein
MVTGIPFFAATIAARWVIPGSENFLYCAHHKDTEEGRFALLVATNSQQHPALKPKSGKGLNLRSGVLLIPPNREIPRQGPVFSGKEIQ